LPTTPKEFISDLKAIKEKTKATPLYTNYAAGWTMGAWDAYIGGTATGDPNYMNNVFTHTKNPFKDPGDGTHAYNVYKILYDAVADGLTEDDYSTTDWETSKNKLNSGDIATMVLGSWAVSQIQSAGDNAKDVGYMPFPISVKGKQYATSASDYAYGINKNSSTTNQEAAMIFVKWLTEKSNYAYNEGGVSIAADDDKLPDLYSDFKNVKLIADEPAPDGEEDLFNDLNSDSELNINTGGDSRVQSIVEHAANKDESYNDLVKEWNQKWNDALDSEGVDTK
ncbi:ABC transporter substrate-binding protein, partial [Bifidobacterium pseudocatenulatum]